MTGDLSAAGEPNDEFMSILLSEFIKDIHARIKRGDS